MVFVFGKKKQVVLWLAKVTNSGSIKNNLYSFIGYLILISAINYIDSS